MCRQPLPPPLSLPSAELMIMALEEYGYQRRRGIRGPKKLRSSYSHDSSPELVVKRAHEKVDLSRSLHTRAIKAKSEKDPPQEITPTLQLQPKRGTVAELLQCGRFDNNAKWSSQISRP
ncbi:hypothetical protein Tco_1014137 [Tanacetum coccineum]